MFRWIAISVILILFLSSFIGYWLYTEKQDTERRRKQYMGMKLFDLAFFIMNQAPKDKMLKNALLDENYLIDPKDARVYTRHEKAFDQDYICGVFFINDDKKMGRRPKFICFSFHGKDQRYLYILDKWTVKTCAKVSSLENAISKLESYQTQGVESGGVSQGWKKNPDWIIGKSLNSR